MFRLYALLAPRIVKFLESFMFETFYHTGRQSMQSFYTKPSSSTNFFLLTLILSVTRLWPGVNNTGRSIRWKGELERIFPGIRHMLQANKIMLHIAPPPSIGSADGNVFTAEPSQTRTHQGSAGRCGQRGALRLRIGAERLEERVAGGNACGRKNYRWRCCRLLSRNLQFLT